jgi:septal ring factor EnvC (AmiA/AmiB activator)
MDAYVKHHFIADKMLCATKMLREKIHTTNADIYSRETNYTRNRNDVNSELQKSEPDFKKIHLMINDLEEIKKDIPNKRIELESYQNQIKLMEIDQVKRRKLALKEFVKLKK